MRKSTRIAVVLAAAALLVAGFAFTSLAGWVKEAEGVYYYEDADGNRVYNEWKKDTDDNGVVKYYYLGDDGYMVTNQLVDDNDGKTFWVGADGAKVVNAWVRVPVEDATENFDEEYRWYRFDAKGAALKKQKKAVGDYDYIFDDQGRMSFGYVRADFSMCDKQDDPFQTDCVYFCGTNEDGAVKKLYWEKIEGVEDKGAYEEDKDAFWVFFKKDGKKASDEDEYGVLYNGRRYYFTAEGKMKTGWKEIGTPSTYFAYLGGEDEGWVEKKTWVYTKDNTSDNKEKWFYTDNMGRFAGVARDPETDKVLYGTVITVKNKQYAFNAAGEMQSGIVLIENVDVNGAIKVGESKVREDEEQKATIDTAEWPLSKWTELTIDGEPAKMYYFSSDYKNDGALHKSASFEAEFADDTYKLYVGKQGQLLDGYDTGSKKYYKNGYLLTADADYGKQVINVNKKSASEENWKVLDVAGIAVKAGKKAKDLDGNWYAVKAEKVGDKEVETIYKVRESQEKASVVADYVLNDKNEITISGTTYVIKTDAPAENGYVTVVVTRK